MTNHFTIKIPCKKYVKAFLESNCGTPADLSNLPDLQLQFERCLRRKAGYRETDQICNYTDEVTLIIPSASFYRYGWEINKEGIREMNRIVEARVKFLMRQYVMFNHKLGQPVAVAIRQFQEEFGFPEPVWAYESIKKDFDRHMVESKGLSFKELRAEINKILLYNLSDLGTISKKLKKEVCNE
jgi:hypothetical protein